jgi:hypothetical protein
MDQKIHFTNKATKKKTQQKKNKKNTGKLNFNSRSFEVKAVHYFHYFKFTKEFLDVHNETNKGHVSQGSDGCQSKRSHTWLYVSYNDYVCLSLSLSLSIPTYSVVTTMLSLSLHYSMVDIPSPFLPSLDGCVSLESTSKLRWNKSSVEGWEAIDSNIFSFPQVRIRSEDQWCR